MKGGKTGHKIHLLLSDDSSSQIQPKGNNKAIKANLNILKQKQQHHQEDHEDQQITPQIQEQIQNFIRKSQLSKVGKKQNAPQFQNKKEQHDRPFTKQKEDIIASMSETQSMNLKVKQSETFTQKLKQYEYMFEAQSKEGAQKKLKSNSLQSQVFKSQFQKNNLIDTSLMPTQHKTNILNIPVYFPYEPYDLQLDYMKAVIKAASAKDNALLQSPTGTGKTLCLLCAVLSWVDHYRKQNTEKINVIYCSRTHSQLRQVQSQLQKTCFRPTMSNFGSRDHFCIKQQFSGIKGRDLMQSCSKAVKLHLKSNARKRLKYDEQNNEDGCEQSQQPTDQNEIDNKKKQKSLMCNYFKSEGEYLSLVQRHYTNKIITSEMIKAQGQLRGFCPYYYAFQVKQKADLIFMPYNYILDVSRLPFYAGIVKNSIIIFDEAHNVPEASCEGRSYEIHANIFINAELELNKLSYHPSMSPDLRIVSYQFQDTRQILYKQYEYLRKNLVFWAQKVYDKLSSKDPYNKFQESFDLEQIYSAYDMKIMIYHWFSPIPFNFAQYDKFSIAKRKQIHFQTVKNLAKVVKQTNDLIQALKETYDGIFQSMQKLNSFISKSMNLIQVFESDEGKDWWTNQANHYRLSIKCNAKQSSLNYNIKLICLTPSLTFTDVLKLQPRSIILTSGTISPLDSWQKQLKLKFNVQLVNKHVIDRSQLHMGILCKSVGNQSVMNFSYNQLQKDSNIYMGLVKTIVRFCQTIPNGILVIFPSYRIIKTFKDLLSKNTAILNQLRSFKQICFEDKNTADFVVLNFKNKARTKKGAILFCVCRGKVSQGLDFSDELCRAVVFVGVPYPNVKDPLIQQKRQYYDRLSKQSKKSYTMALSGDEWYTLNTMRAVNQGIGRVIRHIHDYGVILMLDNRYEQAKLKNMLPGWAKQGIKSYYKFEDLDEKIQSFFDQMFIKYPSSLRIRVQETQQFSQNAPFPTKKSHMNKKQPKKEGTSKPSNAFDVIMRQAKRNSSKEGKKYGKKKNQIDFL